MFDSSTNAVVCYSGSFFRLKAAALSRLYSSLSLSASLCLIAYWTSFSSFYISACLFLASSSLIISSRVRPVVLLNTDEVGYTGEKPGIPWGNGKPICPGSPGTPPGCYLCTFGILGLSSSFKPRPAYKPINCGPILVWGSGWWTLMWMYWVGAIWILTK